MYLIIDKEFGIVKAGSTVEPDRDGDTYTDPTNGAQHANCYMVFSANVTEFNPLGPPMNYDPKTDSLVTSAPLPGVDLTFGQFQDLCYNDTDGGALGRLLGPEQTISVQFALGGDRYGDIVAAVEAAGASGGLGKAALERYKGAVSSGFRYNTTYTFLALLVDLTILEEEEFDAIIDAWPLS